MKLARSSFYCKPRAKSRDRMKAEAIKGLPIKAFPVGASIFGY